MIETASLPLSGKTAFVTGGSGSIGTPVAETLSPSGAAACVVSRSGTGHDLPTVSRWQPMSGMGRRHSARRPRAADEAAYVATIFARSDSRDVVLFTLSRPRHLRILDPVPTYVRAVMGLASRRRLSEALRNCSRNDPPGGST